MEEKQTDIKQDKPEKRIAFLERENIFLMQKLNKYLGWQIAFLVMLIVNYIILFYILLKA